MNDDNRFPWIVGSLDRRGLDQAPPVIIYGINPVLEALRAGRARRIRVSARVDKRIEEVQALAR